MLARIEAHRNALAVKFYLSTNCPVYRLDEQDNSSITRTIHLISALDYDKAKEHLRFFSKYNIPQGKAGARLCGTFSHCTAFYTLSLLHRFDIYIEKKPISLSLQYAWKAIGSQFISPFVRMGVACLTAISSEYALPKSWNSANAVEHQTERFTTYAASIPHLNTQVVDYAFVDAALYDILQDTYIKHLTVGMGNHH